MKLEPVIQHLLSKYDFVSLPTLGSFVRKYSPARMEGTAIIPPREYYVFDTGRIFDDEALIGYLTGQDIPADEARKLVERFVKVVSDELGAGRTVNFPGVGTLRADTEGKPVLDPDPMGGATETFGLTQVETGITGSDKESVQDEAIEDSKKSESQEETAASEAHPDVKPVSPDSAVYSAPSYREQSGSRKGLWVAAAFLILLILSGAAIWFVPGLSSVKSQLISSLSLKSGKSGNEAIVTTDEPAIAPKELQVLNGIIDTLIETVDSVVQTAQQLDTAVHIHAAIAKQVNRITDKKEALTYTEPPSETFSEFYIIIGSFANEANALSLQERLKAKGYKPMVVRSNNMYRVALYRFTKHDRAMRELERIKASSPDMKGAWLLSL